MGVWEIIGFSVVDEIAVFVAGTQVDDFVL